MLENYQREFINLAIACQALKFGEFTLKSGRVSPYFFNMGAFNSGEKLAKLGQYYATVLENANLPYNLLFGPAYKGIPLAVATGIALATHHHKDVPYCFNRKEAKDHGEGGQLVGAPLQGKVVIIDDVITAGTAIRETLQIIATAGAQAAAVVVALDRQERGQGTRSTLQDISDTYQLPIFSLIKLDDLLSYLGEINEPTVLTKISQYRDCYGS